MPSRKKKSESIEPEAIRSEIEQLIRNFESELQSEDLRAKVIALVPVFHGLRELGKSLMTECGTSARDRILSYFRKYSQTIINGNEFLVVSGIQDYPRRIRELRVEFGWRIVSGLTIHDMLEEDEEDVPDQLKIMKPDDYILLEVAQDREAALRWNIANSIRKQQKSIRDKILMYLQENVGQIVTNEELRYVAKNKTEWARRVRELRTELGWPIATKTTGRPDLKVGEYMLEAMRQSPEHDRHIPDDVRRAALRRDGYKCSQCGWHHGEWNPSDPRHLELHHQVHHADGGENTVENLLSLCTVCHDRIHAVET